MILNYKLDTQYYYTRQVEKVNPGGLWGLGRAAGRGGFVREVRAEAGFAAIFNLRYNTQKVLQNDRKATPNRSAHFFGLKIQI